VQEIGAMKQETVARVQLAASMAATIAVACKTREMAANGRWLVHNPWAELAGDADAMEKRAKELRDCEQEAAAFYSARTGKSAEEMKKLMAEERRPAPTEAKEMGFVHTIINPFETAAYAGVKAEITAAGHWPKALIEIPEEAKETKTMEGAKNENGNTVGAASAGLATTGNASQPANGGTPPAEVQTQAEIGYALKLAEYAEKIAVAKKEHDDIDALQRRTQGERDSARSQAEKLNAALAETTAKIERLLSGGMSFTPQVETWEEALKACGNDYEQARKKHPDLYRQRREQDKTNRKS